MAPKRPSVFISYAHHDGWDFTRRLKFSLEMYMDVFWDLDLDAEPYPEQLKNEIVNRDFFLLVMTPSSIVSNWCMEKELGAAQNMKKKILLARPFDDPETASHPLCKTYTYGQFFPDFNVGFRRVTQMMLHRPLSSWEYLADTDGATLLRQLNRGYLPGVIAKEVTEWALCDVLWPFLQTYIESRDMLVAFGYPRTPNGIVRQAEELLFQAERLNHQILFVYAEKLRAVGRRYQEEMASVSEVSNHELGAAAFSICMQVKEVIESIQSGSDVTGFIITQTYFAFNLVEKIRELILLHSRRSRYLY